MFGELEPRGREDQSATPTHRVLRTSVKSGRASASKRDMIHDSYEDEASSNLKTSLGTIFTLREE